MRQHGFRATYNAGCRCENCRGAASAARRKWRDRSRKENSAAYQHELAVSRALKERYRGTCEHCGGPTTGCDGPGKARTVCAQCAPAVYGPRIAEALRGKGPLNSAILDFIGDGERSYTEIRQQFDISKGLAGVLLNRLVRYGLVVRPQRGRYRRVAA